MTSTPTVAIVGSGPIGSAYARVLLETVPDARVIMFEAGPQVTDVPGASVRNLPDAARTTYCWPSRAIREPGNPATLG